MDNGYLYVVTGEKYVDEVMVSARSLRNHTSYPIALVTDIPNFESDLFDTVIYEPGLYSGYGTKIPGMKRTPFTSKTIFLDTDTFIAEPIDNVFDFLDYFQFAMTMDLSGHSDMFIFKAQPDFKVRLRGVLHEFHTGVIGYKNDEKRVMEFLSVWEKVHKQTGFKSDMPSFREAFLDFPVNIGVLPNEYNFYGTGTFAVAYNKIRVLHERIGEKWTDRRSFVPSYEKMNSFLNKINKKNYKRLFVPYLGVIPYNWSPLVIKAKLKKIFGVKMSSKMKSGNEKTAP